MRNLFLALVLVLTALTQCFAQSVNENTIKTIESYVNLNENPCENFFSYACGNWSDFHKRGRYSESTGLVDHKVNKRLLDLFKRILEEAGTDSILHMVLTYFKSCRRDRQQKNINYLKIAEPDVGVNWPLLDQPNYNGWQDEHFNWLLAVANLRRFGLNNALLEHTVFPNLKNSSQSVIDLDKPNLSVNPLPDQIAMLTTLFETDILNSDAQTTIEDVIEFDSRLKELIEIEEENDVLTTTIREIEDKLPNWPWRKYFEIIIGQQVDEDYVFQLRNFAYFTNFSALIEETDAEVVCNYLMFKFLNYLIADRSSSADKIDCMVDVRSKMDLAMNFIYAETFYKKSAAIYTEDVRQLINIIRDEFRKKLLENRLRLSREQIEYLEAKLNAMDLNMGNMPQKVDKEFVKQYYQQLELSPRNYYKNHLALLKLRFEKEHEFLLKRSPSPEDYFFVTDSNTARSSTPFYLGRRNLVVVPYGFLQTPIYHHNMFNVLKFSLFGFSLAHEIAHGFDASGVLYDFEGSAQDIGENITENTEFVDSLTCLQRDETTSIDERIADVVGLRLAFDAYFGADYKDDEIDLITTENSDLEEKKLEKIFFLNFAQFFCGNMATEFLDHDSDNIRLQQTLLNFKPFAETFQCDLGSTMNPEVKCRLW